MFNFKIPTISTAIFATELTVRISDINYGNHLGHDSLITLLQEARLKFLHQFHYSEINTEGCALFVTNLAVNYFKEAKHGDKLFFSLGWGNFSNISMEMLYQVFNDKQKEIARAITLHTFIDLEKRTVTKIPPLFLQAMNYPAK